MPSQMIITILRVLLMGLIAFILLIQTVVLPQLSGEMAQRLPAEAYMRWPILILAIGGLACVQVGVYATYRLLGFTKEGNVFSSHALKWVNTIIGASLTGSLVCVATLVYQAFTVSGPPLWVLLLISLVISGIAIALLLTVMRSLLIQATALRTDLEGVI